MKDDLSETILPRFTANQTQMIKGIADFFVLHLILASSADSRTFRDSPMPMSQWSRRASRLALPTSVTRIGRDAIRSSKLHYRMLPCR